MSYWSLESEAAWKADLQDNGSGTTVATGHTLVGTANTSTVSIAASTPAPWLARAMQFNGTDRGVQVGYTGTTLTAGTLECWVRIDSALTRYDGIIFRRNGSAGASGFAIQAPDTTGNRIGYSWSNSSTEYNYTGGPQLTIGTWYHVVVTVSATEAKIYSNGSLAATRTAAHGSTTDSWSPMSIGYDIFNGGVDRFAPISIKGCRQYNRALTLAEVQQRYAGPEPTLTSGGITADQDGLISDTTVVEFYSNGTPVTAWLWQEYIADQWEDTDNDDQTLGPAGWGDAVDGREYRLVLIDANDGGSLETYSAGFTYTAPSSGVRRLRIRQLLGV